MIKNTGSQYLRITLHDNDFTSYWEALVVSIESIVNDFHTVYVGENFDWDMDRLAAAIQYLWYAMDEMDYACDSPARRACFANQRRHTVDSFKPDISIVDYKDIPDWENSEVIYIPLPGNLDTAKLI